MARQQLVWLEAPGRFELRYPALVLSKLLPQLRQVCEPKQAQHRLSQSADALPRHRIAKSNIQEHGFARVNYEQ